MVVTRESVEEDRGVEPTLRPRVLFVGGYARSGSTILDRALGAGEGFVSVGEIRFIWRRGFLENQLCGCGEPFRSCSFWSAVAAAAWGGMERLDAEDMLRSQARFDQWWRIPELVRGGARRDRPDLRAYLDRLLALYGAIAEVSGGRVIVDSSKDASHGYLLRRMAGSVDLSVLHLVRDPRATSFSLCERRKFDPGNGTVLGGHRLAQAVTGWVATNALVSALGWSRAAPYRLVRYETFAASPDSVLAEIAAFVGEKAPAPIATGGIDPGVQHQVAGNPVRFTRGPIPISPDEEWRQRMSRGSRAMVTATTWPMLACYPRPRS